MPMRYWENMVMQVPQPWGAAFTLPPQAQQLARPDLLPSVAATLSGWFRCPGKA